MRVLNAREAIGGHHRGCVSALANLQALAAGEGEAVLHIDIVRDIDQAMSFASDELRMAEKTVVEALAGTGRERPATLLLGVRQTRLDAAARDVGAAVSARDVARLRRSLTRFNVLVRATCAVQLDVYTSAMRSGPRPYPS
jgi:hypothetical protein